MYMSDSKMNAWNKIYSDTDGYLEKPDEIITRLVNDHQIKSSLDVGAGNGRHSIFLASKGVRVKAIDISGEGLKLLSKNAASKGLTVETDVISADEYYDSNKYDLVLSTGGVLNFLDKPTSIQVIQRLKNNVQDGGYMYITVFTIHDSAFSRQYKLAETKNEDTYYSDKIGTWVTGFKDNELKMIFENWIIIEYFEKNILDDGHGEPHYHHTAGILAKFI